MNEIQKSKQQLESDIKKLVEDFHKENPGYEVYRITPVSQKMITSYKKQTHEEITNVKLTVEIMVI